jgi:hypothetical protein
MKSVQLELKWALIFSLTTLAWMLLERLVGLHDTFLDYHMYLTNLFAIPAVIVMVLALREKRALDYDGSMNYLQGLKAGVIISIIIALLSPLTQWITSYVITPDYFTNVIERSVEIGYFESKEAAEAQFNYKNYAIQSAVGALIMGTLTTAIAMIFLREK